MGVDKVKIPYAGKDRSNRDDLTGRPFDPAKRGARHREPRSERLDLRLTPTDKHLLRRVADAKRRTFQSLLEEWLDQLAKENPLP